MSISQYLSRYAEAEAAQAVGSVPARYEHALIIPAKDEAPAFLERLISFLSKQSCIAIVVVNQSDTPASAANVQLWSRAQSLGFLSHGLGLLKMVEQSACLLIDRYSQQPIAAEHGVGLARKIGADTALALFSHKHIQSPWIHTTDADVFIPKNYFCLPKASPKTAARIYPFHHQAGNNDNAIRLYEMRQHYYVAGLAWAKSPYAYTTVGSTMIIHAEYYAKVRGFPKLAAGEDFHMLNKLAKTGLIDTLTEPRLTIENRLSSRVPFGTGPTMIRLHNSTQLAEEALFESPHAFEKLKNVICAFDDLWQHGQAVHYSDVMTCVLTQRALAAVKFDQGLQHAFKQSKTQDQFKKQLHSFFDALVSLRFLHAVDAELHGKLNLNQLLAYNLCWFDITPYQFLAHCEDLT